MTGREAIRDIRYRNNNLNDNEEDIRKIREITKGYIKELWDGSRPYVDRKKILTGESSHHKIGSEEGACACIEDDISKKTDAIETDRLNQYPSIKGRYNSEADSAIKKLNDWSTTISENRQARKDVTHRRSLV